MLPSPVQRSIQKILSRRIGHAVPNLQSTAVGGGSINQCYRITSGTDHFFCKVNDHAGFPRLFEKEMQGLQLLAARQVIRTPEVIHYAVEDGKQYLLLEWIEPARPQKEFWKNFGTKLALLHRQTGSVFGLDHDNYMGSVPQNNQQVHRWTEFFVQQRLQALVMKCSDRHLLSSKHVALFEQLYSRIANIFTDDDPPSLLHGDLWSGNFLCDRNGDPCLIDPAVYYGHRSVDLAMTTLFGGFEAAFYEAYDHHFPLPLNYKEQWKVCNLYPLLIHLLLFGKTYLRSIEDTLHEFA